MKKHNIIYETENKVNGKIYVGKHSTDNLGDGYLGSGEKLKKAIKKHGKKNFFRRILDWCLPCQYYIDHKEQQWIEILDAQDRVTGYNITGGGGGGDTISNNPNKEAICKKISEANKGKKSGSKHHQYGKTGELNPFYGKKHSEETREKLSELGKLKVGDKNPMFGRKHKRYECPHCGKLVSKHMMTRYHGDNCKLKK